MTSSLSARPTSRLVRATCGLAASGRLEITSAAVWTWTTQGIAFCTLATNCETLPRRLSQFSGDVR